jgi:hypothetical protein
LERNWCRDDILYQVHFEELGKNKENTFFYIQGMIWGSDAEGKYLHWTVQTKIFYYAE